VSLSLIALRERGMAEAVLGVDADNPTGALGVYEANGFAVNHRELSYRKPF
jgi:ribosomal protein S18 acetylase RimI-like enzyme